MTKGTIELLEQLYRYCSENARVLVIKSIRNLLKIVHSFPGYIYAAAVDIVSGLAHDSKNVVTLQYASSCFHIFAQDNVRNDRKLAMLLIRALPKLLTSVDPVTQYYVVETAGNMFFSSGCGDVSDLQTLVLKFVEASPNITDNAAIQALTVAFAKLSQESKYMDMLIQNKVLFRIIKLLLG